MFRPIRPYTELDPMTRNEIQSAENFYNFLVETFGIEKWFTMKDIENRKIGISDSLKEFFLTENGVKFITKIIDGSLHFALLGKENKTDSKLFERLSKTNKIDEKDSATLEEEAKFAEEFEHASDQRRSEMMEKQLESEAMASMDGFWTAQRYSEILIPGNSYNIFELCKAFDVRPEFQYLVLERMSKGGFARNFSKQENGTFLYQPELHPQVKKAKEKLTREELAA